MPNTLQTKGTNVPKSKTKSRINKRQRNRRRNKQKQLTNAIQQNKTQSQTRQTEFSFSQSAQKNGSEVWSAAYENAVRWHGEHQNNFWRHAAEQLENENQMLRQQLHNVARIKPERETQVYYETSDEEEQEVVSIKKEEADDEVDSKYLEFLQITIKHREELRLKREAADKLEQDEASTTPTID
ncbi:uncharacterized protein LOC129914509 [Episyrphus balteatus]|uniref:uncharacterized protein LOC129914509 n=1 Tax=Episyrphus balteatus TaxID=286459 RepID=UPI002486885C|nr:uncharacterized protein LOC129914509 [Episyrphus balteatus]